MVHAARASVNRATARFILRSGSAASKGRSTTPPSPRHLLIPRSAIKIARNSPENNALKFSNRPNSACSSAHSAAHNSPLATQKISHPQLVSVLPAISNRHKMQLESPVTSRKQTTAPNSYRHKFSPNSTPALPAPAVTTHGSQITGPRSRTALPSKGLADDDGIVTMALGWPHPLALIQITGTKLPR
jgi:hypothetical protein